MKLGQLLFGKDGRRGIFFGYDDQGRKIGVNDADLMELFEIQNLSYKIDIKIQPKNKMQIFRLIAKLIPNSIKQQLIEN